MANLKTHYPHLMQPIQVGNREFKSRINFSPVYSFFATKNNEINRDLIEWLRTVAAGGANTCICGTGVPNEQPPFITHLVSIWDDSCINQLSILFDTIHAYNCIAGIELMPIAVDPDPFDMRDKKGRKQIDIDPDELTYEEIHKMIKEYADAAERVLKAGGDMVVFHCAHLQAPAAFFSKVYNHRHDEYGCDSFENRARFLTDSLNAIRERVGDKLLIEMRMSWTDMVPGCPTLDENIRLAKMVEDEIDWLHISRGQLDVHELTPYVFPPTYFERGFNLEAASKFKEALNIPVSCVGGMDYEIAEKAIAEGKIDMVEFARPLLADPEIPNKLRLGREDTIRPCIRCNNCINRTHNYFLPIRCAINPVQGRELVFNTYPNPKASRRVGVIGGGPAGMQAAITAGDRGHKVTLYEASDKLGGTLNIASAAPLKADLKMYLQYLVHMVEINENVEIRLNSEATPEMIEAENFDYILVSVGSEPIIPAFTRGYGDKVAWIGDVELGKVNVGENVIIAGAGMTGMEAAYTLSEMGKKVTLIDMLPASMTGQGGTKMNIIALRQMLDDRKIETVSETKLLSITGKGILVSDKDGKKYEMACDTLVLSLGVRQKRDLAKSFRDCAPMVVEIGDCMTQTGTIMNATHTGYDAAMAIL